MSQDDDPLAAPPGRLDRVAAPATGPAIRLERLEVTPVRSVALDLPQPAPARPQAPVFETLRVVELRLLRMGLARKIANSPRWVAADAARATAAARVIRLIDAFGGAVQLSPPDVVVVNRASAGVIERVFSVVNGTVYLGATRCGVWLEGSEDAVFLGVLADALEAAQDHRLFHAGARDVDLGFQNGTDLQ